MNKKNNKQHIDISERLNAFMSNYGLRQTDLAEVAGVSRTAIGTYQKGAVIPPASVLINIAKHYKVSIDWLCGITESSGMSTGTPNIMNFLLDAIDSGIPDFEIQDNKCVCILDDDELEIIKTAKRYSNLRRQGIIEDSLYDLWRKQQKDKLVKREADKSCKIETMHQIEKDDIDE